MKPIEEIVKELRGLDKARREATNHFQKHKTLSAWRDNSAFHMTRLLDELERLLKQDSHRTPAKELKP